MLPEIHFLGLTLQTFGLMLALALVCSGVLVARRLRELGKPVDWAYEMLFFAGVGGIAGAKLWYVIEKGNAGGLFSGTGLVFYGGAIGGALAVMAWASRRGMLNAAL
ncbi:MAG: prolipoprotein diacylglyceryl transferase, partial [Actinomycetota bacterium]|nr:prolipoprotein diacylglyceryl transferase [Actinomycetota bacterium]